MQQLITIVFVLSQVGFALGASLSQSSSLLFSKNTQGVSIAMFISAAAFGLINAILSYRIWRPVRKRVVRTCLTDSEKEGRTGFYLYLASFFVYGAIATICAFNRIFFEHTPVFAKMDLIVFCVVTFCILFILYICKTSEIEQPFSNPYISGVTACFIIGIPQLGAALTILRHGGVGVSEKALWFALWMVVSKLLYYTIVWFQSEDSYKKSKATGVLIAETGNLLTWVPVLVAYNHVSH